MVKTLGVYGLYEALEGLRLPFKQEVRSDCHCDHVITEIDENILFSQVSTVRINPKDLKLLQNLIRKGDDHAKVLRFITVGLFISTPRYFWSEFDTYRNGVEKISESTMHTIINEELTKENFLIEDEEDLQEVENFINLVKSYKENDTSKKKLKRKIKKRLPESYIQSRVAVTNYQTLRRINKQREKHELTEWQDFLKVIKTLPLAEQLIFI
jgi:hypothetical protein